MPLSTCFAAIALALALPFAVFAQGTPDANLRAAEIFLRHGRLEAAQRLYREFLDAHPDERRAEGIALRLAEVAYGMGDDGAADEFRAYLHRFGYADAQGRARYGLAEALFREGDYVGARGVLEGMLAADIEPGSPYLPLAHVRLGWTLLRLGETGVAERHFRLVEGVFEGSPVGRRARLGMAVCTFDRGEYAAARELFAEVLAAEPAGSAFAPIAEAGKALSGIRSGDEPMPEGGPDRRAYPMTHFEAVRTAVERGEHGAAVSALRGMGAEGWHSAEGGAALRLVGRALAEAADGEPSGDAAALLALAEHRLWQCSEGKTESLPADDVPPCAEALQLFQEAAEAFGEGHPEAKAFALTRAGVCAERLGNSIEAGNIYERAATLAKGSVAAEALAGAARAALNAGQWEEGLGRTRRLLAKHPAAFAHADALLAHGVALVANGQPDEAAGVLGDAAIAAEDSTLRNAALLWQARALADSGRGDEAAEKFHEFLSADGSVGEAGRWAAIELGMELLRAERADEVLDVVAPRFDGQGMAWAEWLLGATREALGDWEEAAGHFGRAAELAREGDLAANSLLRKARCYYRAGDGRRAAEWLEVLLAEHGPSLPPETLMWATVHWHGAGRPDKALAFPAPWIEGDGAFITAHHAERDGYILGHGGSLPATAHHAGRDGCFHGFAEQALFLAGRCLMKEKRWHEAAEAAGRLVREHPDSRFAKAATADWAEALIRSGRPAEGRAALSLLGNGLPRLAWLEAESYRAEGRAEEAIGGYKDALERLGSALEENWKFRLNAGLGRALLDAGRQGEAAAAFRAAADAMPSEPEILAERLRLLSELENLTGPL